MNTHTHTHTHKNKDLFYRAHLYLNKYKSTHTHIHTRIPYPGCYRTSLPLTPLSITENHLYDIVHNSFCIESVIFTQASPTLSVETGENVVFILMMKNSAYEDAEPL